MKLETIYRNSSMQKKLQYTVYYYTIGMLYPVLPAAIHISVRLGL